jgi:regulator of cell morphogenesis and NO signaling
MATLTHCDWTNAALTDLIEHLIKTYHEPLRAEMDRLMTWLDRIATNHGQENPRLVELRDTFHIFRQDLIEHMETEEREVFGYCHLLERASSGDKSIQLPDTSVRSPLRQMIDEHDDGGQLLLKMRLLTDNYAVPEGACPNFRMVFESLAALERQMHEHVRLENCVLAFKAEQLEFKLRKGTDFTGKNHQ